MNYYIYINKKKYIISIKILSKLCIFYGEFNIDKSPSL